MSYGIPITRQLTPPMRPTGATLGLSFGPFARLLADTLNNGNEHSVAHSSLLLAAQRSAGGRPACRRGCLLDVRSVAVEPLAVLVG
jgi:hypothetical protein